MDESAEPSRAALEPELTGDPAVDSVLSRLRDVAEAPVGEHAALYGSLHDGLLAALNEEPGQVPAVPAASGSSASSPVPAPRPQPGRGSA
ncbi:hypothetical protein ACWGQ2_17460 [Arthrobacter sp. NPDC055585]